MINKEEIERDYMNAVEAANFLGLSISRVSRLCSSDRFQGAMKIGRSWLIPREAVINHKHLKPGPKDKATRKAEDIALLKSALEEAQKIKSGD